MLKFAICEIGGKQYKIFGNMPFNVVGKFEANKILEANVLLLNDGEIKIGKPYLKNKLKLRFLENLKGDKIRISKYHAKANFRKTTGSRNNVAKFVIAS